MVSVAEKSGVRLNWLDQVIGEVSLKHDLAILVNKENRLSN